MAFQQGQFTEQLKNLQHETKNALTKKQEAESELHQVRREIASDDRPLGNTNYRSSHGGGS